MSNMFKKLDSKIKKVKLAEKATALSPKEKKLLEKQIIFGNLVETLDSLNIEDAYKEKK
jgi:hypothetical protein